MKKALAFMVFITICGCSSKVEIYHGYTFNDVEKIDEKILTFKSSTKNEVELQLGTPTFAENNDDKISYFYVEDVFKKTPIIGEDKLYSRVLRIDFTADDKVILVEMYKVIGRGYFNSKDKTNVTGHRMGFFEQMKRNLMSIGQSDE
jgi:outer membrane protein assembly factor BamE (lipoprotein component of BamABCDE complex)